MKAFYLLAPLFVAQLLFYPFSFGDGDKQQVTVVIIPFTPFCAVSASILIKPFGLACLYSLFFFMVLKLVNFSVYQSIFGSVSTVLQNYFLNQYDHLN